MEEEVGDEGGLDWRYRPTPRPVLKLGPTLGHAQYWRTGTLGHVRYWHRRAFVLLVRMCYAMSGTYIGYAAIPGTATLCRMRPQVTSSLRACYAKPGTDLAYGGTRAAGERY
eukprot:3375432-Rhodomonas_salina.3